MVNDVRKFLLANGQIWAARGNGARAQIAHDPIIVFRADEMAKNEADLAGIILTIPVARGEDAPARKARREAIARTEETAPHEGGIEAHNAMAFGIRVALGTMDRPSDTRATEIGRTTREARPECMCPRTRRPTIGVTTKADGPSRKIDLVSGVTIAEAIREVTIARQIMTSGEGDTEDAPNARADRIIHQATIHLTEARANQAPRIAHSQAVCTLGKARNPPPRQEEGKGAQTPEDLRYPKRPDCQEIWLYVCRPASRRAR